MLKAILPILIGAVVAILIFFLVFHSFKKKSMLLMKAVYIDKDYDAYRKLLNSWTCKLFLSKKQRLILNMAVYEGENKENELLNVFEQLHRIKLNAQQDLDLYYNEIRYYMRKKNTDKIEELYHEVKEKYKNESASYIKGILKEMYYLYEVDYKENTKLLSEVKKLYENISVEQSKGIFAARCCRLYLKKNDLKNAKEYYEKAVQHLNKEMADQLLYDVSDKIKDFC